MAPLRSFRVPVVLSSTLKKCQIGPLERPPSGLSSSAGDAEVAKVVRADPDVEGVGADDLTLPPPFLRSPRPVERPVLEPATGAGGTKSGSRSLSSASLSEAKRRSSTASTSSAVKIK